MNETGIEKRAGVLREKGQYVLVFGIIALMLYAVGFPLFLLFFVGVLTYFIWKVFASEGRGEIRRIFEFYLLANEMLRDDDRRWYGFEIREVVERGERIVKSMPSAPPLVFFGLGALYQKLGDHAAAAEHLSRVVETETDEVSIIDAGRELREYVAMLRKIERTPAESPVTSAAVRSLERARRNRAAAMLEESRRREVSTASGSDRGLQMASDEDIRTGSDSDWVPALWNEADGESPQSLPLPVLTSDDLSPQLQPTNPKRRTVPKPTPDRQTISEVLHDIYDNNA